MTATQNQQVGRRTFVMGIGATAAAGVGLASTRGPVGQAQAIPPIVIGGAAAGASAAFGWALREFEVIGSDSPPEGLTPEALHQRVYEAARTRQSTNASTFIDNKNILDGVEHTAYIDGKITAIEALNDQQSQSEVYDQAEQVVTEYATTIEKNFLQGWEESVNELINLKGAVDEHEDTSTDDIFKGRQHRSDDGDEFPDYWDSSPLTIEDPVEIELSDGSTFEVTQLSRDGQHRWDATVDTPWEDNEDNEMSVAVVTDAGSVLYLHNEPWSDIWNEMQNTFSNVLSGLSLWVEEVYGDVQSGEIEVEELITPRERAAMMEEDEGMAQAIADLAALNIPVDVGREATVYLPHVDATIRGTVGATGSTTIEAGESYDPDTIDGSIYLTYDASLGEGTWDAFETGVDGGTAVFTAEPWEGVIFVIETIAGESVTVTREDFTAVDANGDPVEDWEDPDRWEVDLSDDLETAITEIESVAYFAESEETDLQTIRLSDPFEVTRIEDSESGEEVDQLEYSQSEPQSDDNYITQEEWNDLEQQNQELIDKYEEAGSSGDGLLGGGVFGDTDIGGSAAVVGAVVAVGAFGIIRQAIKFYLPGR